MMHPTSWRDHQRRSTDPALEILGGYAESAPSLAVARARFADWVHVGDALGTPAGPRPLRARDLSRSESGAPDEPAAPAA